MLTDIDTNTITVTIRIPTFQYWRQSNCRQEEKCDLAIAYGVGDVRVTSSITVIWLLGYGVRGKTEYESAP